jgi:PilZ domain
MSANPSPVNGGVRRSPRIAVLIPINVAGQDHQKRAFSESATAINVNLHGAAIRLNRQLIIGSAITVTNQIGIKAAARIVAQVGVAEDAFIYGIEFILGRQPNLLGVSFYASTF